MSETVLLETSVPPTLDAWLARFEACRHISDFNSEEEKGIRWQNH